MARLLGLSVSVAAFHTLSLPRFLPLSLFVSAPLNVAYA